MLERRTKKKINSWLFCQEEIGIMPPKGQKEQQTGNKEAHYIFQRYFLILTQISYYASEDF